MGRPELQKWGGHEWVGYLTGLKVSRPLIANMILFVNINNCFNEEIVYVRTFSVAHWDTQDNSFAFPYARGRRY